DRRGPQRSGERCEVVRPADIRGADARCRAGRNARTRHDCSRRILQCGRAGEFSFAAARTVATIALDPMSLSAGARIGPYEIVALLGAGGMGEVYRTTDRQLKRQVALKVLPESVAADPQRLARFRREAEVLAALNHPNIAAIYGFEDDAGTADLVMEL